MTFPHTSPGYWSGATALNRCWQGTPSPFETRLLTPVAVYPLEQLRQRFIYTVVDPRDARKGARVTFQMAFEIETEAFLNKLITMPPDVVRSKVCERRRFLDIDADLQRQRYLVDPAIDALAALADVPDAYVDLLRRYANAPYPRYRTCALAATVCLAVRMLTP